MSALHVPDPAWRSQLLRGTAELAVLSMLAQKPRHGFGLLEASEAAGFDLAEGTVYPLLARLEQEGKIRGKWVMTSETKRPRKVHSLTALGHATLRTMRTDWQELVQAISRLMPPRGALKTYGSR